MYFYGFLKFYLCMVNLKPDLFSLAMGDHCGVAVISKDLTVKNEAVLFQIGNESFTGRRVVMLNALESCELELSSRKIEVQEQWLEAAEFVDAEGAKQNFEVYLKRVSFDDRVPVLKLSVHKAGTEKSVFYVWGEVGAARVGVNVTWIQVGCTRVK